VAVGDRIYHGRVAQALCYSCHGQDGKGTDTAPNLADAEWLNSDGSFNGIVQVVTAGVPNPKEHATAMPPMGGTRLSQEQIQAVSAYVYSLSHPDARGQ
jgi:mono/diheme cytochrome c family protein